MSRSRCCTAVAIGVLAVVACERPQAAESEPSELGTPTEAIAQHEGGGDEPTAEEPGLEVGDLRRVGSVDFPISCDPAVFEEFQRGVALLHSFFYAEARRRFEAVLDRDPDCAMAFWGVAMSWYHPIWTPPRDTEFAAGRAAVHAARAIEATTERERGYIDALAAYYEASTEGTDDAVGMGCHGPTDHLGRATAWSDAMADLHTANPDDAEAASFYALSLLGSAVPTDTALTRQRQAAGILEPLWQQNPDHPGVAHYLIHAYDYPSLAERGLPAATAYAEIAPWVPHVLHMPSHIFTRLGMWPESVECNLASAAAARAYAAQYHPDAASFEELHALDYLAYAYLQMGRDAEARAIVEHVAPMEQTFPEIDFAVAYAVGAIPARYTLERRAWSEAAALTVPPRPYWSTFPFGEAHIEFARALGATRAGDVALARQAVERLGQLAEALTDPRLAYFRSLLELQVRAANGWLAHVEGRDDEALALMRDAADAEDALGKHPVSPGAIVPIRELLGDLQLELGHSADALTSYQTALTMYPRRLNTLYGAGRAAELAGQPEVARGHYTELVALTADGDGERPEVAHARAFVAE